MTHTPNSALAQARAWTGNNSYQKAGVTLASHPLSLSHGSVWLRPSSARRRGAQGSRRGRTAGTRGEEDGVRSDGTMAQGGGYVLVTFRLDSPSTSARRRPHNECDQPAPRRFSLTLGFLCRPSTPAAVHGEPMTLARAARWREVNSTGAALPRLFEVRALFLPAGF